jgi:hypothetical protein
MVFEIHADEGKMLAAWWRCHSQIRKFENSLRTIKNAPRLSMSTRSLLSILVPSSRRRR